MPLNQLHQASQNIRRTSFNDLTGRRRHYQASLNSLKYTKTIIIQSLHKKAEIHKDPLQPPLRVS